jgi:phosphoribosylglycinamide formyltransferase-1
MVRRRPFSAPRALRDALQARVTLTGASLIEITPEIDRGPLLARKVMALAPDDDERKALERLHDVEREVVCDGISAWLHAHRQG